MAKKTNITAGATSTIDAPDPLESLREAVGTAADSIRVYRLDPANPSDTNGEYLGRHQAQGFDLDTLRDSYGGGSYRLQLIDGASGKVKAGGIHGVRIAGQPKSQHAAQVYGSPAPAMPSAPAPVDRLALIEQKLEALTAAKVAPANAESTMVTMLLSKLIDSRVTPPANPLEMVAQTVPLIRALTPRSNLDESLRSFQLLRAIEGERASGGGGRIDDIVSKFIESDVGKALGTELAEELREWREFRSAKRRKELDLIDADDDSDDAESADDAPAADTTTTAAKVEPMSPAIIKLFLPRVAKQLADALEKAPNTTHTEARCELEKAAGAPTLRSVLVALKPGELSAIIAKADKRLKTPDRFMWLCMLEAELRANHAADAAPRGDNGPSAEKPDDIDEDGNPRKGQVSGMGDAGKGGAA